MDPDVPPGARWPSQTAALVGGISICTLPQRFGFSLASHICHPTACFSLPHGHSPLFVILFCFSPRLGTVGVTANEMAERLAGWEAMQMQGKDGCSYTMHAARNVCEMKCTFSKGTSSSSTLYLSGRTESRVKGTYDRAKEAQGQGQGPGTNSLNR